MKLPNDAQARVDREKITEYLLCSSHSDGWNKAEFFSRFGFDVSEWQVLASALRLHGQTHPVKKVVESTFGTRYIVEGPLETPDGRAPRIRTVWIVEEGSKVPRLITAHPG